MKYPLQGAAKKIVLGRWTTRQLPAQTINAGNWTFNGLARNLTTGGVSAFTIWGFCVAQWRSWTGVVARFLDSPTGGTEAHNGANTFDRAQSTTVAGGSLTLTANDQIILEVWAQNTDPGTNAVDLMLCLGGLGQFESGVYTASSYTDTDAVLVAPQAIVYQ